MQGFEHRDSSVLWKLLSPAADPSRYASGVRARTAECSENRIISTVAVILNGNLDPSKQVASQPFRMSEDAAIPSALVVGAGVQSCETRFFPRVIVETRSQGLSPRVHLHGSGPPFNNQHNNINNAPAGQARRLDALRTKGQERRGSTSKHR